MAKKKKEIKTNAVRMVEGEGIPYTLYTYEAPEGFLDGVSVAKATGVPQEKVFKTLVTVGASGSYYVCVVPVAEELDLKKGARHFKEKSLEMLPAKDITKVTGYIKGGCSPVGMKKLYPTVIHQTAELQPTICVSGGKVGLQMELSPARLAGLLSASFDDMIKSLW